jgi:hypothetical protein
MGFAGTAAQNAMPAVIHSTTDCSGLEAVSALAMVLWCSTVPVTRPSTALFYLSVQDRHDASVMACVPSTTPPVRNFRREIVMSCPLRGLRNFFSSPEGAGQDTPVCLFAQGPFASALRLCSSLVSLAQKVCLSSGRLCPPGE